MNLELNVRTGKATLNGVEIKAELEQRAREVATQQILAQILRVENRAEVPITRLEKLGTPEKIFDDSGRWQGITPVRTHYLCPSCGKPTYADFEYADELFRGPIVEGFVPDPFPCVECEIGLAPFSKAV